MYGNSHVFAKVLRDAFALIRVDRSLPIFARQAPALEVCLLHVPQQEPRIMATYSKYIPERAVLSYTSKMPQHDIVSY